MTIIDRESDVRAYLREIRAWPRLSVEEEQALAQRVTGRNDPAARELLVCCNLRLVVCIARQFIGRGLAFPDLIGEGNVGLIKAAGRFEAHHGTRFSTYAVWWIRQAILKALATHAPSIRVPGYMAEMITKLRRGTSQLECRLNRSPTVAELSAYLGLPVEQVRSIHTAITTVHSLGRPVGEDGRITLTELLKDRQCPGADAAAINHDELSRVHHLLNEIDDRASRILKLRYGLEGGKPMTLKEVGEVVNLTRERVRQIEHETLRDLRTAMAVNT